MECLLLLSSEIPELSKEEAIRLLDLKKYDYSDKILIADISKTKLNLISRLAYTKKAHQLLFVSTKKNIEKDIENYNWNTIYQKNFSLKNFSLDLLKKDKKLSEKYLSSIIYSKIKNPKVNLKSPTTKIEFLFTKSKIYACKLIHENKEDFESRKSQNRPEPHPSSLHPKLARALINLTGSKTSILDPMCGSGGILIEAGLMNLKPIGYDIDQIQINRAKINLQHYKIKNYKLKQQDALKIKQKFNYIITDLPYGSNTKITENLYENFLRKLRTILKKTAVIGFPEYKNNKINYKKLIKQNKLKIEKEFSYYIHKNLSKKLYLVK